MATISRTGITTGGTISPSHITNIIDALDGTSASTTVIASGSFSGSLTGLATTSTSASYAISSSFATTATTATNATNTLNIAVTDTTTGTGPYYITFVDGTSSNKVARVDSTTLTYNATTNLITATASYANQALSASYAPGGGTPFPYVGTAQITGSLFVSGSADITLTGDNLKLTTPKLDGSVTAKSTLIVNFADIALSSAAGKFVVPLNAPISPTAGTLYWDDSNATLYIYQDAGGGAWRSITF
jgi:hypothetical protein